LLAPLGLLDVEQTSLLIRMEYSAFDHWSRLPTAPSLVRRRRRFCRSSRRLCRGLDIAEPLSGQLADDGLPRDMAMGCVRHKTQHVTGARKLSAMIFAYLQANCTRQRKAGGVFWMGHQKEVSGATKPYGEALITASI
jgi:hypothetical protein